MSTTSRFSEVAKEAFATAKADNPLIETIEVYHPSLSFGTKDLDLCFVVDTTGSEGANISLVKNLATSLATSLASSFEVVRFSLVTFKDENETTIATGPSFVGLSAFTAAIDLLTAAGGGDAPENGYGAIKLACDSLPWVSLPRSKRAIFLTSGEVSHFRGATQAQALAALADKDIVFSHFGHNTGFPSTTSYAPLATASGGLSLTSSQSGQVNQLMTDLLLSLVEIATQEPLYLVNEMRSLNLGLETSVVKTFQPCGFKLELPEKSDTGIQDLNIVIDNTNGLVSDFIEKALEVQNQSIRIIYRPYLGSDLTQPQMNPPLVLFLTSVSSRGAEIVGTASFSDFLNKTFLSEKYTLDRFPALQ